VNNVIKDVLGQVNFDQARSTILTAIITGAITAVGVIQTDLPKIVDTIAPLGIAITFAIAQLARYLASGDKLPPSLS
jgi:hypothetical protein